MRTVMTGLAMLILSLTTIAYSLENIETPKSCQRCRMDRTIFAQSRLLVHFADGVTVGVCSLNCAVEEMMANGEKQVKSLQVADFNTSKLADARLVTWVVGGKKKGVMTALPKWAFIREEDAHEFLKDNGGEVISYEQVITVTRDEVMKITAEMAETADEIAGIPN
jgi:hypothetical protein